jgi:hypothetical protein
MITKPIIIVFYLPQFHPIPENDEWWGKGFTEWTNVAKAKPLFRGHYQPKIPADLGFYDLRLPEVREEQANLAQEAGIEAFCYWHYWFGNGKQLLERPLQDVVKSGKPNFPFCLGWANHSWYRKDWNPSVSRLSKKILIEQTYPGQKDIENHFYTMINTFKDERYYKTTDGRLIFLFSNCEEIPNFDKFVFTWQELAKENGLPPFFFIGYAAYLEKLNHKNISCCDAAVLSLNGLLMFNVSALKRRLCLFFGIPWNKMNYKDAVKKWDKIQDYKTERVYPSIFPNWDHSARLGAGGFILHNSTPDLFKQHLKSVFEKIKHKNAENQFIFIKSWNEWAEGNYLEPDIKFGKGYLDAIKHSLQEYVK